MLSSILVLADGSPQSELALTEAVALARNHRARLTLLAPVQPLPSCVWLMAIPSQSYQRQCIEAQARTLMRVAAALPQDLSITTVVREGRVAHLIRDEIRRGSHDLVVLGEPTATGLRRLLAPRERRIARRLPTAVLLVAYPGSRDAPPAPASRAGPHAQTV